MPAIAIGANDFAGTGLYSSEYIVGSYGINRTDIHFGLGWGQLNNPKIASKILLYIYMMDLETEKLITNFMSFYPGRYFSGDGVSPLFGISHAINDDLLFKLEYDNTSSSERIEYPEPKENFSYGFEYNFRDNFIIDFQREGQFHFNKICL